MKTLRTSAGFTLIELMVTIAVLGVIVTLAVPSFEHVAMTSKLRAISNELASNAYLARSEAIKRNAVVRLCSSTNGTTCDGTAWKNGWIVLAGGAVVQRRQPLPLGYQVMSAGTNLAFQPSGFGATASVLTVCRLTPSVGDQERVVTVDVSGRADVSKTTAGACS